MPLCIHTCGDTHIHRQINTCIYTYISSRKRNKTILLFLRVEIVREILLRVCYCLYYYLRAYHQNHHFEDKRLHDLYCVDHSSLSLKSVVP